jgi:hypothetical protein
MKIPYLSSFIDRIKGEEKRDCGLIKNRNCEPAECLLQSHAAATHEFIHEVLDGAKGVELNSENMYSRCYDVQREVSDCVSHVMRVCALDKLIRENPNIEHLLRHDVLNIYWEDIAGADIDDVMSEIFPSLVQSSGTEKK